MKKNFTRPNRQGATSIKQNNYANVTLTLKYLIFRDLYFRHKFDFCFFFILPMKIVVNKATAEQLLSPSESMIQ